MSGSNTSNHRGVASMTVKLGRWAPADHVRPDGGRVGVSLAQRVLEILVDRPRESAGISANDDDIDTFLIERMEHALIMSAWIIEKIIDDASRILSVRKHGDLGQIRCRIDISAVRIMRRDQRDDPLILPRLVRWHDQPIQLYARHLISRYSLTVNPKRPRIRTQYRKPKKKRPHQRGHRPLHQREHAEDGKRGEIREVIRPGIWKLHQPGERSHAQHSP